MASIVDKHGNVALFGRLSWGNLVDWLITICLGGIIVQSVLKLGGVRPDAQLVILPLYALLLALHGLWLAVDSESPKRLSQIPLWFLPALVWLFISVSVFSPVPWLGWYEMIYALQAFIIVWVLSNNLRTRAHLWALIIMVLAPSAIAIFTGFYQFFQDPGRMVDAGVSYRLELNGEFLGRATGAFADPNSFAAFLLILLPSLLIAAAVRRLPIILRILCFYIAVMFFIGVALTQAYWASVLVIVLLAIVPWFCFRRLRTRILFSFAGVFSALLLFFAMVVFHPLFEKGLQRAASTDGEGVRMVLWEEAVSMFASDPVVGVGAGAYSVAFQQSSEVSLSDSPITPHNDYLLVLSQLGFIGFLLLAIPIAAVARRALRAWRNEPYAVKLRDSDGTIMPPQRFFLSLGLAGSISFGLCMLATFVFYVPGLMLYGLVLFSILIKATFNRRLVVYESLIFRSCYCLLALVGGVSFYVLGSYKLEAHGLEIRARQQLDHLVNMRVHVSGNAELLDEVVVIYEDALISDSHNVDAWIGLSSAICQQYFKNPAEFDSIGRRAVDCAERAVELSPDYWMGWAQLGVANSFFGQPEAAEDALLRAIEMAPNSSNANYYYAAFLGADSSRRVEALDYVKRALEINPGNSAARRLEQKLLIL